MLPTFPKVTELRSENNMLVIKQLAGQFSPMVGMIARNVQFEGEAHQITREDNIADETPMAAVSAEIEISRSMPLAEFNEEALEQRLAALAEQMAKGMTEQFCGQIQRVTAKVGNVVDGGGRPMDEDMLLATYEKMEHSFDAEGRWRAPTIFGGSTVSNIFPDGTPSAAFNEKLGSILERKRDDFRRREADRVLAG